MIVRRGITRTVILIRRYAIKVPSLRPGLHAGLRGRLESFAKGYLANQSEYRWSAYEPWAGQIAPVRHSWLAGMIQVYPRCEPLPRGSRVPRLDPEPGDRKPDNFGVLDGRVVRLDYDMN